MRQFHLYQSSADTHYKNILGLGSLLQLPSMRKDWDIIGIHGRQKFGNHGWRKPLILCRVRQKLHLISRRKIMSFMDAISRGLAELHSKNIKPCATELHQAQLLESLFVLSKSSDWSFHHGCIFSCQNCGTQTSRTHFAAFLCGIISNTYIAAFLKKMIKT